MVTEVNQRMVGKPQGVYAAELVRVVLMKYVLWLSRIRRNWIESEVERRASEVPRRVLGETYEVPVAGGDVNQSNAGPFTKLR